MIAALSLILAQTPWKPPFQDVERPKALEAYAQKLGDKTIETFLEGDLLTIVWKSKPEENMWPGFTVTHHQVPGTNIKVAQAKMSDWDKAFFNVGVFGQGSPAAYEMFTGPNAPAMPEKATELKGEITKHKLKSQFIDDERDVHVYLPPNPTIGMPVVYLSDGGAAESFAKVIEPFILAGKIEPLALVGVLSGGYLGDRAEEYDPNKDVRALEYLKVIEDERYEKHLNFFTQEVIPWAQEKYSVSRFPRNRAVMGYSNGGAFAVTASVDRPLVFGSTLAYSVAAFDRDMLTNDVKGKRLGNFYISAGTLEPFIRGSRDAQKILADHGARTDLDIYVSSHSSALWEVALVNDLQKIFPGKAAQGVASVNDRKDQPRRSQETLGIRLR